MKHIRMANFLMSSAEAAAEIPGTVLQIVGRIVETIFNPIIALLFGIASVAFVWGVLQYLISPDNEEAREKGKKSMLWGIIGMFIMVSVFGIIKLIINTIGADSNLMNFV
jgi:zinc transporter ZupT